MGKKKETLDFSNQDISFKLKEQTIKVLSLNQNSMNVEVLIVEDAKSEGIKKKVSKMAFAHLPKEIKKLLRPI
jgi:hypothetical protein